MLSIIGWFMLGILGLLLAAGIVISFISMIKELIYARAWPEVIMMGAAFWAFIAIILITIK